MKSKLIKLTLLSIIFNLNVFISSATTYYVDLAANGFNNGSSWPNAFLDFQSALDVALSGDIIYVGVGIYHPTKDKMGINSPSDPRTVTFFFDKDIKVYGGFESGIQVCDEANPTVFSGDIYLQTSIGPAYNVCVSENLSSDFIINCISIQDGESFDPNHSGAGWFNDGSGSGNSSNPTFENCIFRSNNGYNGGAFSNSAINNGEANPLFMNCTFADNFADNSGGAMYNDGFNMGDASPTIAFCNFDGNDAIIDGGAISNNANLGNCKPDIISSVFTSNQSLNNGGAIYINALNDGDGDGSYSDCTFQNNSSNHNGGAVYVSTNNTNYRQSEFINCDFNDNMSSNNGAGVYCLDSNPQFDYCNWVYNIAGHDGGALAFEATENIEISPDITNCIFEGNTAIDRGGAIIFNGITGFYAVNIHYSKFILNQSYFDGGAICSISNVGINSITIRNSIFSYNYANNGAMLYALSNDAISSQSFINCSISKNNAYDKGAIVHLSHSNGGTCEAEIFNSISSGNVGQDGVYLQGSCTFTGYNTMHEDEWTALWGFTNGAGCITGNPLFNNTALHDLTIAPFSPAIDAGSNAFSLLPLDLAANPRIIGISVDMGAYEFDPATVDALEKGDMVNSKVYPNPLLSDKFLTIEISTDDKTRLSITNSNGTLVYSSSDIKKKTLVNTFGWSRGTYIVRLNDEVHKIIKLN